MVATFSTTLRQPRTATTEKFAFAAASAGKETVLARDISCEDAHRDACQQWVSGGGTLVVFHNVLKSGEWVVMCVDVATGKERLLGPGPATRLRPTDGRRRADLRTALESSAIIAGSNWSTWRPARNRTDRVDAGCLAESLSRLGEEDRRRETVLALLSPAQSGFAADHLQDRHSHGQETFAASSPACTPACSFTISRMRSCFISMTTGDIPPGTPTPRFHQYARCADRYRHGKGDQDSGLRITREIIPRSARMASSTRPIPRRNENHSTAAKEAGRSWSATFARVRRS